MSGRTSARESLRELEEWFLSYGHRLEFELSDRTARWTAVVLPGERPMGGAPLLSARGETKLDAAGRARTAFLEMGSDD